MEMENLRHTHMTYTRGIALTYMPLPALTHVNVDKC